MPRYFYAYFTCYRAVTRLIKIAGDGAFRVAVAVDMMRHTPRPRYACCHHFSTIYRVIISFARHYDYTLTLRHAATMPTPFYFHLRDVDYAANMPA